MSEPIKLSCKWPSNGELVTVERQAIFEVDSLVVVEYPPRRFSVTHRPTGHACLVTDREHKAIRAAKAFAAIKEMDWPTLTPEVSKARASQPGVKDRIIGIVAKFGALS